MNDNFYQDQISHLVSAMDIGVYCKLKCRTNPTDEFNFLLTLNPEKIGILIKPEEAIPILEQFAHETYPDKKNYYLFDYKPQLGIKKENFINFVKGCLDYNDKADDNSNKMEF